MSDMRRNTGMNPCLSQSNDISAPYILLCNYADAAPKLVSQYCSPIVIQDKGILCYCQWIFIISNLQ